MYTFAICDDDKEFTTYINKLLKKYKMIKVITMNSYEELINISKNHHIDAVIIDIVFGKEKNGIDIIKEINNIQEVVYITGYAKYCTDVYETNHTYFLLKPLKENEFEKAIKKVLTNLKSKNNKIINIKKGFKHIIVELTDINYIESNKRKVIIHTRSGDYEYYSRLTEILSELDDNFIMPHKSFIVNLERIKEYSGTKFILDDDTIIPISQSKYKSTKEIFFKYLKED